MVSTQPSLALQPSHFAALSPHRYLLAHLAPQSSKTTTVRPSGRKPTDFRRPAINTGSLTYANGSAVVRCENTTVVAGVRAEILRRGDIPDPPEVPQNPGAEKDASTPEALEAEGEELARLGLLVPNIDLSTGCSPTHLPGLAPSSTAQSLTQRLLHLLHSTRLIRLKDLRILHRKQRDPEAEAGVSVNPNNPAEEIEGADPGEIARAENSEEVEVVGYWTLYISIQVLSLSGTTSLFDVIWLATLSALQTTIIPHAYYSSDLESILCSDSPASATKLSLRGMPIASTFAVFEADDMNGSFSRGAAGEVEGEGYWVLADPDEFESGLCKETVTVVVDSGSGKSVIKRIEKNGGGRVERGVMKQVVRMAEERWREVSGVLEGLS